MDEKKRRSIRTLSLEHWFINYQLEGIKKSHFHLPATVDVDVTRAMKVFGGEKPTSIATALSVKAIALAMESVPEANRMFVRTYFGPRLVFPDYVSVNVPILVEHEGRQVHAATVVQAPHRKTILKIRDEIRTAVTRGLSDKPVVRFISSRQNNWCNRLALRILHKFAYRFPSLLLQHRAGAVSLSSLLYVGRDAVPMTISSFGPTAFTVSLVSAWQSEGRWSLRFGVAFDHYAGGGELAIRFMKKLADILNGTDADLFGRLTEGARIAPPYDHFEAAAAL